MVPVFVCIVLGLTCFIQNKQELIWYVCVFFLQTNGLTERFNQTISRCLAKLVDESQTNWDEKIDTVLMGYRASRQASTKHSPYFLLFHQQMRLPIDSEVLPSSLDQEDDDEDDLDQKIQILLDARQKAFKEVEANIEAAQKSQKETYDRKHQAQVLPEGTEVLLENTYQKQRKGGKMDPLWLGPYTIHRNLGKGLYELKNKEGKLVKKKANINRLKVYRRRNDEVTQSSPNNSPPSSPNKSPQSSPTKSPSQKRRKVCYACICTSGYYYLYVHDNNVILHTIPDIYGAYVEEEPWFDSERQGCP